MTTDPTRQAALALLSHVLDRRRTLEAALDQLPADIASRDRAAAHRITACVLRRTGSIDAVLECFLQKEPPVIVRHILRLGCAQLLFLGTPPHAAVTTAVELARERQLRPFASLVNAVLRRVAEHGPTIMSDLDAPRLDTPAWLWASWGGIAREIATAHAQEASLDLTVRVAPPPGGTVLPTGSVRFPPGTSVQQLPGYDTGEWWVQDAAAAMPVRLLDAKPGETAVDLCAAPGGKAAQLAATGVTVTAVERDSDRLQRLRANLARVHADATVVQADAMTWQPPSPVDAVLLDAPCSATGTIRRHPDVLHLKRPQDVKALVLQQAAILAHSASMLKLGGRLIYAVCSLQPEEGRGHLPFAAQCGLQHEPFSAAELARLPEALTADGCFSTHPGLWSDRGGLDGFFAARFRRI